MPYQSRPNNIQDDSGNTSSSFSSGKSEKEKEKEATKKAIKTGTKAGAAVVAGAYTEGQASGVAAKAVDKLSETKAGQKMLDAAAEVASKVPGVAKKAKKADEQGKLDAADKAVDTAANAVSAGAGGGAGAASGAGNSGQVAGAAEQAGKANIEKGVGDAANKQEQLNNSNSGLASEMNSPSKFNPLNRLSKRFGLGKKEESSEQEVADSSGNSNEQPEAKGTFDFIGKLTMIMKIIITAIPVAAASLILLFFLIILSQTNEFDTAVSTSDREDINTYEGDSSEDPEVSEMHQRIMKIHDEYKASGKEFNSAYIAAVYTVTARHNKNFEAKKFKEKDIKKVADMMFEGNTFSEDHFKQQLASEWFPKYLDDPNELNVDDAVDEVFEYVNYYFDIYGIEGNGIEGSNNVCYNGDSCVYEIKGFNTGSKSVAFNQTITDLQVRLMEAGAVAGHTCGGTYGKPMQGEDLVPFEKYALGVAYAEVGDGQPDECFKTQVISARSFALTRTAEMGSGHGHKLAQEGNQWILQISSCVNDQVYCDPDKGCSKDVASNNQWGMCYSGANTHAHTYKEALPSDSKLRTQANEVNGKIPLDANGYVYNLNYRQSDQTAWKNLAAQGYNYEQIIYKHYPAVKNIVSMNCGASGGGNACTTSGTFSTWKQGDPKWSSVRLGNSEGTVGSVGCLVTSVAMLIKKSGVNTTISDFNPGTFATELGKIGGFDSSGSLVYAPISTIAPNFQFQNWVSLTGSESNKAKTIKSYLDQGYYIAVRARTNQHWVAVDRVDGDNVIMWDPASDETSLFKKYPASDVTQFIYFKVG